MKKNVKIATVALSVFIIGSLANNIAMSEVAKTQSVKSFKVAIVDVQKVVANSKEVNALKEDQKAKVADLTSFVDKAKADVAAEKDLTKRKALEDSYNKELNVRKSAMDKDYAAKLATIDKNISTVVAQKAKAQGYDLVLSKGIVLYGGEDITTSIAQSVK
jgi:Skp family chaperone for outer membrane proteins